MIMPLLDGALDGRWVLYTLFRKMMLESFFYTLFGRRCFLLDAAMKPRGCLDLNATFINAKAETSSCVEPDLC